MLRSLCLTRKCLGMVTRIECIARPLAGEQGLWTVLCAAGMAGEQPSVIKAQGPFCGPRVAESVLAGIAGSLLAQGYAQLDELLIWRLHMQAQLRRMNGERSPHWSGYQSHPER